MLIETRNSTYEVDFENKKVRRLVGKNHPTLRQTLDGEWQNYHDLIWDHEVGMPMIFIWRVDNEDGKVWLRSTKTSVVKGIYV